MDRIAAMVVLLWVLVVRCRSEYQSISFFYDLMVVFK